MSLTVNRNSIILQRNLKAARDQEQNSLERLGSGKVFTRQSPRAVDRAIAERMQSKVRSLNVAKRNINDACSLLNVANEGLSIVANTVTRMKELNIAAATSTVSDQERRYMFIEYEALRDEVERIARTTEFNGIALLDGESATRPESLVFRIGDPKEDASFWGDSEDLNEITIEDLKEMSAVPESLEIGSALDLLEDSDEVEGISLEDSKSLLESDDESFATVYDHALAKLATHRSNYGSVQSRLDQARNFIAVYEENLYSSHSRIANTDYAEETLRLLQAQVAVGANTALMAQSNVDAEQALILLRSTDQRRY